MKVKISPKIKEIFAKKFLDLANIGAGAVLFGQFIAERKFAREELFFAGIMVAILYSLSFNLLRRRG